MLQKVINENLYNKKRNIPVMEEQEIVNDYDDVMNTKGFQQVKKIVESYGFKLKEAGIYNAKPFISFKYEFIDGGYFEIKYNNTEHGSKFKNDFLISGTGFGYFTLKEMEERNDIYDNGIQLCKKLLKMDLMKILPVIID